MEKITASIQTLALNKDYVTQFMDSILKLDQVATELNFQK